MANAATRVQTVLRAAATFVRRCALAKIPFLRLPNVVLALLVLHAGLLMWSGYRHSPVFSEVGHLSAGISHWQLGRFDLYRVNPPLVRMIASLPVMLSNPSTSWSNYSYDPLTRSETVIGLDFVNANGPRAFWFYAIARWACIPFSLIGGLVCYWWSRDLFGIEAGLIALALWCFCPTILGNAALIMPDVPAAALGALASYMFWRWLKHPTWLKALLAGAALGIAELTKTTLVIFFPLFLLLWLAYRCLDDRRLTGREWFREIWMAATSVVLAVYIINIGYGFEGSGTRLGSYFFQSKMLSGSDSVSRNRFVGTWLESLPIPLPKNYIQGIDRQKFDFEEGINSYFNGQWSNRGWWYFYLFAAGVKVPLGTWLLFLMATIRSSTERSPRYWRENLLVLGPLVAIVILVSSQTGFSIHFRYLLPAFPFAFIWASSIAATASRLWSIVRRAALAWSVAASMWYYPHSLSYFNELAEGPEHGWECMIDSSISWGQDLLYLKQWYDEFPDARPLRMAVFSLIDPSVVGIHYELPPVGPDRYSHDFQSEPLGPQPGWFVIDVNCLVGGNYFTRKPADHPTNGMDLRYFRRFRPVGRIGYSMMIYHISTAEANHVRRELGLPEI